MDFGYGFYRKWVSLLPEYPLLKGELKTGGKGQPSSIGKVVFKVIGAKKLQDQCLPNSPLIRYFNVDDKIQAEKISEFMKFKLSDNRTQAKYHEDFSVKPGYIEI